VKAADQLPSEQPLQKRVDNSILFQTAIEPEANKAPKPSITEPSSADPTAALAQSEFITMTPREEMASTS